eukprot:3397267-Alexandrium_andersonii.AAC.1
MEIKLSFLAGTSFKKSSGAPRNASTRTKRLTDMTVWDRVVPRALLMASAAFRRLLEVGPRIAALARKLQRTPGPGA